MLAVGALVASILAVGAGPTAAQPASTRVAANPNHNPDAGADWSACVGAAKANDAGFSDVGAKSVHADAIDCIEYYGITLGIGDGLYGPDSHVTAFQMRLFVQRAADLMGADGEEVLSGVELSDTVTRLEMAQLMFRLVDDIDDDVRISPADGQIQFRDDTNTWTVVNDYFADAKAQVPIFESQVVGAAYELGITRGTKGDGTLVSTPDSTFEPFASVSRAQMASFIARTLDHSNLRPAGMAVQRNLNRETMVSYRDTSFAPIEDARIDVFSALYPEEAFDEDDGSCEAPNFVDDETPSHSVCEIDIGDQQTDDEGNVLFTLKSDSDPITAACASDPTAALTFSSADGSLGKTIWAWTGDLEDEVDEDTDLQELEPVNRPLGKAGPDYASLSGGLPTDDELAKMGETVTFTLQLKSQVGAARNAEKDISVGPDRSRNPFHLRVQKYYVARTAADGTRDTAGEALTDSDHGSDSPGGTPETKSGTASTGQGLFQKAPGDWDYVDATGTTTVATAAARPFNTPVDTVVWPNGDGEYVVTLTNIDLNAAPAVDNTDVGVHFTLTPFTAKNDLIDANLVTGILASGNYAATSRVNNVDVASGHVIFSDDASDPHAVTGATSVYRIIGGSSGNSVSVKVVDQYGDGMRNVAVSVYSNLDAFDPDDDSVTYPEEVDVTLQAGENGDGDTTAGEGESGGAYTATSRDATTRDGTAGYATFVAAVPADPGPPAVAAVPAKITINPKHVLRQPASFIEDDVEGSFNTRRDGTYRIGYTYTGAANANAARTETITPESIEVVSAVWDPDVEVADRTSAAVDVTTTRERELGANVKVYWAKTGNSAASRGGRSAAELFLPVLESDVPSQAIVVNEPGAEADVDNPMVYFYDEDDTFVIAGVGASFEMFEEALKATYSQSSAIWVDYIKWRNYVPTRPGRVNRTIWELTLSCADPSTLRLNTNTGEEGNAWVAAGA